MNKEIGLEFNKQGILVDYRVDEIRQGDSGVVVSAFFAGKDNTNYIARINFTRPDGSKNNNILMNPDLEPAEENKYEKKLDSLWYFAKHGTSTLTVFLVDSAGNEVANGRVVIPVQQTDFSDDPTITPDDYAQLLAAIVGKADINKVIITRQNVPEISEIQDYQVGQYFYIKSTETICKYENETTLKAIGKISEIIHTIESIEEKGENYNLFKLAFKNLEGQTIFEPEIDIEEATETEAGLLGANDKKKLNDLDNSLGNVLAESKGYTDTQIDDVKKHLGHYLTNENGESFATYSEFQTAIDTNNFYYGGEHHEPDENDYVYILEDEEHENATTRYVFTTSWNFQVKINDSPLTQPQVDALNSTITATKVTQFEQAVEDIGNLATEVDGKFIVVPTTEVEGEGAYYPNLTAEQITTIYNAVRNKKVAYVMTYSDNRRTYLVLNSNDMHCSIVGENGIVVDYWNFSGEVTAQVHKIGEGGGTGTVKKVNGVDPNEQGEVTLHANNIALKNEDGTVEDKFGDVEEQISELPTKQFVIEQINGHADCLILDTTFAPITEADFEGEYRSRYFCKDYKGEKRINSWQELVEYVNLPDGTIEPHCVNAEFNSKDLDIGVKITQTGDYFAVKIASDEYAIVRGRFGDYIELEGVDFRNGFNIYTVNSHVYERWIYKYPGSSVMAILGYDASTDYTNYYTKNQVDEKLATKANLDGNNTFTGTNTFSGLIRANAHIQLGSNSFIINSGGANKLGIGNNVSVIGGNLVLSPNYVISDGTNEVTVAQIEKKRPLELVTSATTTGALSLDKDYKWTVNPTSINVVSFDGTGDHTTLSFIAGANLSLVLPTGVTWAYGNVASFEEGQGYKVIIEKGITDGTYTAYLVLA